MKREEFVSKFLPFLRPVAGMIYDEIQNVRPLSGKNTSVSDAKGGGKSIDAKGGGGPAPAALIYPWQPFPSAWQGTGSDPNASNRILRFKLGYGQLAGRVPENMMDEFLAYGDAGDTTIDEDDAVYTTVYLQVPVSEDGGTNSGNIDFGKGTIKIVEGSDDLDDLLDDIPDFGDDGSVPAYIVVPLCVVGWFGGSLAFYPGYTSYLDATISISGVTADGGAGRDIFVAGTSQNS